MARTTCVSLCGLLLVASGCSAQSPRPTQAVDCTVLGAYEFKNIADFAGGQSGWFLYADNTPGGVPDPLVSSNVAVTPIPAPGRCGDTGGMLELQAYGHNFYGTGFGDYANNPSSARADGTGYQGISFWARSQGNSDKTFMVYVDDGQTIVLPPPPAPDGGLPVATSADQDLDGDGLLGPGDIARGTECRLPPPQALGTPACYNTGALPPATPTRVPDKNECGNQFHTYVTTTTDWQLFLIPWSELAQWPCPNRLEGGVNPADIAQVEIKLLQGTNYDIWLDNIAFYRLSADGGS